MNQLSTSFTVTQAHRTAVLSIIDAVLNGEGLSKSIKAQRISPRTFAQCLATDRELGRLYAEAQEFRGDLMADEIIDIVDNEPDAAKARNQMTARQWLASKFNRKYGERIDLNVSQTIDIGSTLAEARARSLPVRYQPPAIDVQTVDLPSITLHGATDKQSVSVDVPAPGAEPDIFS